MTRAVRRRGLAAIAGTAGALVGIALFAANPVLTAALLSPVVIVPAGTVLSVPAAIDNTGQPGGLAACMAHYDCHVAGVVRIQFDTALPARLAGVLDSALPIQVALASGTGNVNIGYDLTEPPPNGTTAAGPGYLFWLTAPSDHVDLATDSFNSVGPVDALPAGSGTLYLVNWSTTVQSIEVVDALTATPD